MSYYPCDIPDCVSCELLVGDLEEKLWDKHVHQALQLLKPEEESKMRWHLARAVRRHPALRSHTGYKGGFDDCG